MKVLVLGATGGTGKQIVTEARQQGHSVVGLVRKKEKPRADEELVLGDVRDEAALFRALDGCDGVISALGTQRSRFAK
jgi:uncharacterized protein YbjT (DUF2867 family)